MRLRRTGWAGVELESEGVRLVIDHLGSYGIFESFLGPEVDELVALEDGSASAALVTHLHRDHCDAEAIGRVLGPEGVLLRPAEAGHMSELQKFCTAEAEGGLPGSARVVLAGEEIEIGPFTVAAAFAVDGLASPQVSWVVSDGSARVFHGGDTMWHAAWWEVADQYGPIDVALLPANGVVVNYPVRKPFLEEAGVLTPRQAVDAAYALGAGALVPIHFNQTFLHEEYYRPLAGTRAALEAAGAEFEVALQFPSIGDWIEVGATVTA